MIPSPSISFSMIPGPSSFSSCPLYYLPKSKKRLSDSLYLPSFLADLSLKVEMKLSFFLDLVSSILESIRQLHLFEDIWGSEMSLNKDSQTWS